MKLNPRTTYLNNGGAQVMIVGLTGEKIGGQPLLGSIQPLFWSIQGDHYAQDGRFVRWTRDDLHLLSADARESLASEDTSEAAKRWWVGVK